MKRLAAALAGSLLASVLTGFAYGLRTTAGLRWELGWRLAGLLAIPGLLLGALWGIAALALTDKLRARLGAFVGERSRPLGALALLAPPLAVLGWGLMVRLGHVFMTAFHHVGLAAMAQGSFFLVVVVLLMSLGSALGIALSRRLPERRVGLLGLGGGLLAAALFAHGLYHGDVHGRGGGVLGGFGVLRKPELDLTPVARLAAVALGGPLLGWALRRWGWALLPLVAAAGGLLRAEALRFADSPVASEIDARPGLPRAVLRTLRRRADRDRDGYAGLFGGGDCDDRAPARSPGATEVPGNGVDEDCSGEDAPAAPPPPPPPPPSVRERLHALVPEGVNVALITVDTLRWDTHYAGRPFPITPRLDRLASEGVVFDHGYAISSYTGRAIGPMMTSRYPTECPRDSEHFTRYPAANVFLAERLRAAGFHTFGAASHFYFEPRFGLAQGMELWDLSAHPSGDRQETEAADSRVTDRVLALLRDPAHAQRRFFLWVHYFDPHKLYVEHPDLPLFGRGERARYDREVMSTDREVGRVVDALDALSAAPGGRPTVLVVTADHGEAFGEHGMGWHGVELWDELVRVPWILRAPGLAPRHVTERRSQIDLVPTLLELLRMEPPPPGAPDAFSGVSLVPDLLGEPAAPRPVYMELPEGPYNSLRRSVIDGGWKLTERGVGRWELYDLTTDPGERTNQAATNPAQLARMRRVLERVRAGLHTVPAPGR
ncbi:MAG: sulfatase-like hydrolase/transferase [Deltaproteobacteria bacterium]|nr:sulfatase-like hydrolase/transferase [Deltaproteobacteria bacterium]